MLLFTSFLEIEALSSATAQKPPLQSLPLWKFLCSSCNNFSFESARLGGEAREKERDCGKQ